MGFFDKGIACRTLTAYLTGDHRAEGERIGREVGADEVHTEFLPGDQVSYMERSYGKNLTKENYFTSETALDRLPKAIMIARHTRSM